MVLEVPGIVPVQDVHVCVPVVGEHATRREEVAITSGKWNLKDTNMVYKFENLNSVSHLQIKELARVHDTISDGGAVDNQCLRIRTH